MERGKRGFVRYASNEAKDGMSRASVLARV